MAGKLKDDQIRWILSVESKGIVGELVEIASATSNLKEENANLEIQIKKLEGEFDSVGKQMQAYTDSGLEASEAYKKLSERQKEISETLEQFNSKLNENNQAIATHETKYNDLAKTLKLSDLTMNQLRIRAQELQNQLDNTSASAEPKVYKQLQKELAETNDRMFSVQNTGKSMLSTFASMHNPVGSAARAVQGFIQVLNYLVTHPIIAIIALIVTIFMKLKDAITQNETAMNSINRILAPLKAAFDAIISVLMEAVNWILKMVEAFLSGLSKIIDAVPFLKKWLGDLNEFAKEAVRLEQEKQNLQKQQRENLTNIAEKEKQIAILRADAAQKDIYNAKQRIEKLEVAKDLELEITKIKIDEAKAELKILELEKKRKGEQTEILDKIAQQAALLIKLETEYFTKERSLNSSIAAAKKEDLRDAADAAKKALDKRLKDEENALNQQVNQLKQSRLQGLITEKEYNKEVERLTIESLHRKINIKGQEKDKILQLEAQILDAQIKQQNQADNELLDELNKAKENQLLLLESARNSQLEILQEQESDQKIYALRAAEIEAESAKAREEVIRAFGETLENAEFQNNQIRLDAIEKNGKEIISAEAKTLEEQGKLRKQFARSIADFERLYNIKTWKQRKDDELRILQKQFEAGLIAEETYCAAKLAIDKKFEEEKKKIREQYELASLKELFYNEVELLKEHHKLGLLDEEEYQKALLNIKLKYAQEYSNKAGEFTRITADTVKAFAESETATLNAEYTKRHADLTKMHNQGLISKEEYNSQKEKLDYEEKKKTLDIQKKYADVNFAMQAAEIISSGATAAINAYKAMAGIPVVGPALGAAAAALVAITAALRLKQAKAERDRVKAMTLDAPGGGGSSGSRTGHIQLREGFAEGGFNLSSGGYTGPGGKYEVAGYLPVHRGEYVIAQEELRNPIVALAARSIESLRRERTTKNAIDGLAEGGYNYISAGTMNYNERVLAILQRLESGDIIVQTNYGITEMEAEQKRKMEVESIFTKE